MDRNTIESFLIIPTKLYNESSPYSYQMFIDYLGNTSFDQTQQLIAEKLKQYLIDKNSKPSTVIFQINDIRKKEIIDYLVETLH